MRYQGKFEGNAARALYTNNQAYPINQITREQTTIYRKKKMRKMAAKAFGKRILMAIGLLIAYASLFGMGLGLMLLMAQPKNIWAYLIWGISIGYTFLVLNCRAFEYIGDRMGSKW